MEKASVLATDGDAVRGGGPGRSLPLLGRSLKTSRFHW